MLRTQDLIRTASRRLTLLTALALGFCAPAAKCGAQWDSLPRQEPSGGASAQAGWGGNRYSQLPQAAPAPVAKSSWTSWMWPSSWKSESPRPAATPQGPGSGWSNIPSQAQPANAPSRITRLPAVTSSPPAQTPRGVAPPATPTARPWIDSDLWGVGPMPGSSIMRNSANQSAVGGNAPVASPPARTASLQQPDTSPNYYATQSAAAVGYRTQPTAPQQPWSVPGTTAEAAPGSVAPPTMAYNGNGLPGMPLAHWQPTGVAPEPVATPSLVAEPLANADPDDFDVSEYEWTWQMLPKSLIYHTYLAGVKEPRLSAVFNGENNRGSILDLTAGARVGLLRYGTRDVFEPDGWQLDVEGAAFPRLDPDENMDLESSDFKFGVPLTYGWGRYQMKIAYSHLSSHLGDEFAIRNGLGGRVNYSRDALVWGHSFYPTDDLRLYFELGYAFHCDVNEEWDTQFGIEYSPICNHNGRGAPFVAFNSHLRQEVNFGGNFVFQAGWQWTSPETAHRIRLGVQYYNGNEEQFEFYSVSEQKVGLGLWYDF